MDDNESITDISESNLLLDSREEKESQPSPTTINISNTTTTNSSEAPIPQLAKSRATSEVHIQTNITESEIDAVSNRRSPLKIHTETYNNDKDHTAGSQIFICSLPVKPATMVVHIMSVAFVVAVAIVMKTGTSLFSWHPFFMSLGFIFFIAQAILVFSPSSSLISSKPRAFKVKTHWILHLCGVTCIIIGVIIIYVNKEINNKPHATSWHGFLGFTSAFQLCAHCIGGILLLYPVYVKSYFTLAQLKQMHATIGLLGFFLGATVVVLGLMSNAFVKVVSHDVVWYAFAFVPVILAGTIGNQVTTAYGPKKVKVAKPATK